MFVCACCLVGLLVGWLVGWVDGWCPCLQPWQKSQLLYEVECHCHSPSLSIYALHFQHVLYWLVTGELVVGFEDLESSFLILYWPTEGLLCYWRSYASRFVRTRDAEVKNEPSDFLVWLEHPLSTCCLFYACMDRSPFALKGRVKCRLGPVGIPSNSLPALNVNVGSGSKDVTLWYFTQCLRPSRSLSPISGAWLILRRPNKTWHDRWREGWHNIY